MELSVLHSVGLQNRLLHECLCVSSDCALHPCTVILYTNPLSHYTQVQSKMIDKAVPKACAEKGS